MTGILKNIERMFMLATIIGLLAPVQIFAGSPIWAPADLADLISEGLLQNNEIRSLAARVQSLKEEISFAGALDDPRLGLGNP